MRQQKKNKRMADNNKVKVNQEKELPTSPEPM